MLLDDADEAFEVGEVPIQPVRVIGDHGRDLTRSDRIEQGLEARAALAGESRGVVVTEDMSDLPATGSGQLATRLLLALHTR